VYTFEKRQEILLPVPHVTECQMHLPTFQTPTKILNRKTWKLRHQSKQSSFVFRVYQVLIFWCPLQVHDPERLVWGVQFSCPVVDRLSYIRPHEVGLPYTIAAACIRPTHLLCVSSRDCILLPWSGWGR